MSERRRASLGMFLLIEATGLGTFLFRETSGLRMGFGSVCRHVRLGMDLFGVPSCLSGNGYVRSDVMSAWEWICSE